MSEARSSSRYDKEAYRLSANYSFGDGVKAFVSYGKGFRFPATDEFITWGYYDSWSGIFIPTRVNRNIQPQTTKELDMGVRWNLRHRFSGTVVWFEGRNRNEIFFDPITYANENYDKTKRRGVESTLFVNLAKGLSLDLSYSCTDARFDGGRFDGNRIPAETDPRNRGPDVR